MAETSAFILKNLEVYCNGCKSDRNKRILMDSHINKDHVCYMHPPGSVKVWECKNCDYIAVSIVSVAGISPRRLPPGKDSVWFPDNVAILCDNCKSDKKNYVETKHYKRKPTEIKNPNDGNKVRVMIYSRCPKCLHEVVICEKGNVKYLGDPWAGYA